MRWQVALGGLLAMLGGCKDRVSYAEPDVAASKAAWGCAEPKGDAVEACRMLDAFERSGMVTTLPDGGMHTWWGREYCSDMRDDPKSMLFGWLHLMPGAGDAHRLEGAELDPTKTLPYHADLPTMSVSDKDPKNLEGYRRLLAAAASGKEPDFSGLDGYVRGNAEDAWRSIRKLAVSNPPKMRLTKSEDGKTVLANNAIAGNADGHVTGVNLRQQDNRIYQLKPGKQGHCISELYRLP